MKRIVLSSLAMLVVAVSVSAQQMQSLPNDPATRVGKLDNGLTYYIRHNDKPAQRAEFYLATNVGAIQETPDQDGLAHFLEHMCFNGTKNFPGKNIISWLESIGASFGGNVNASTGVERTVYMLTNIPLVRPTVVDSCILILHDYSHFVNNDPVEIDKERGVIIEERRTRRTAGWRMYEQELPLLYKGSKYAGCTLIGSEENLRTFQPQSLVNFYKTWYRPDMQAVIVVGDIDVDATEAKLKAIFADIPAAKNPKAKDIIKIPENKEPIVGIITDPEASASKVSIIYKGEPLPKQYRNTVIGVVADVVKDVISSVMNERLSDIMAKPDAPFIGADFGIYQNTTTMEALNCEVVSKDAASITSALEAYLTEIEKMHRFGFTDDEIARAKADMLANYESRSKKAETRKNNEFIYPIIGNFFNNYPFMDPQTEYQLAQTIFGQVNSEMINKVAKEIISTENIVIYYTGPAKEGTPVPTESQLLETLNKVQNAQIEAPKAEALPTSLLDDSKLKGASVKSTREVLSGVQEVVLSNGVKILLNPNENEKDKILIKLQKKGGRSLLADKELFPFEDNIWQLYADNSGVGGFKRTVLTKMLAGKNVSVTPFVGNYTHGINAKSTVKDIETALQLMYLVFTQPGKDEDEFNQGINQIKAVLPNIMTQPNFAMQQVLYKTAYTSPRSFIISEEVVAKANLKTLLAGYSRLFKSAAGTTVIISGDFKSEELLPLLCKYIGSLPKGGKATDWKYCKDGMIDKSVLNDFKFKMATPKTSVYQIYNLTGDYSVEKAVANEALGAILRMCYVESLREDEGGTYGAGTYCQTSNAPHAHSNLIVAFDTNVEQADKLREIAKNTVKEIAEKGPDAEKYEKTVKNLLKKIPEKRIRNGYWMNVMTTWDEYGFNLDTEYEAAVKALTADKVKAAAAEFLGKGNLIELVMRPE